MRKDLGGSWIDCLPWFAKKGEENVKTGPRSAREIGQGYAFVTGAARGLQSCSPYCVLCAHGRLIFPFPICSLKHPGWKESDFFFFFHFTNGQSQA